VRVLALGDAFGQAGTGDGAGDRRWAEYRDAAQTWTGSDLDQPQQTRPLASESKCLAQTNKSPDGLTTKEADSNLSPSNLTAFCRSEAWR
jgi:hypothetical protein